MTNFVRKNKYLSNLKATYSDKVITQIFIANMNFTEVEDLKKLGFIGFKSIGQLFSDNSSIPDIKGVYCIFYNNDMACDFLVEGCGGHFKKKNPNVTLLDLQKNWVNESKVVYIGKAGGEGKKPLYGQD